MGEAVTTLTLRALPSWYKPRPWAPPLTQADIDEDRLIDAEIVAACERELAYRRYLDCLGCSCFRCRREAERLLNENGGWL